MSEKYAAIRAHRSRFPVRLMCEALGVSVGGFYGAEARRAAPPSARRRRRRAAPSQGAGGAHEARRALRRPARASGARGGRRAREPQTRRATDALSDGLVVRRRKFVRTTGSTQAAPVAPNRLARRFAVAAHPEPGRA